MQIRGLHKNIYRLNRYALSQEKCDQLRQFYEIPVRRWQRLRKEGVNEALCAQTVGISRATYYRYQHMLRTLEKGRLVGGKRPFSKVRNLLPLSAYVTHLGKGPFTSNKTA